MSKKLLKPLPFPYAVAVILAVSAFVLWIVLGAASRIDEVTISQDPQNISVQDPVVATQGTASILINFGGGDVRKFEGGLVEGMTAFDALTRAVKAGGFNFETVVEDGSINVKTIGQKEHITDGGRWQLYLNDEYENYNSPLDFELEDGDEVEFRYE